MSQVLLAASQPSVLRSLTPGWPQLRNFDPGVAFFAKVSQEVLKQNENASGTMISSMTSAGEDDWLRLTGPLGDARQARSKGRTGWGRRTIRNPEYRDSFATDRDPSKAPRGTSGHPESILRAWSSSENMDRKAPRQMSPALCFDLEVVQIMRFERGLQFPCVRPARRGEWSCLVEGDKGEAGHAEVLSRGRLAQERHPRTLNLDRNRNPMVWGHVRAERANRAAHCGVGRLQGVWQGAQSTGECEWTGQTP